MNRDQRYDQSPKGIKRRLRFEATRARKDYKAKWMRDYRRRLKRAV